MALRAGDAKHAEQQLRQRRSPPRRPLRLLGQNVHLQLAHHVTQREAEEPFRTSSHHSPCVSRPRGDAVGVVEDAEGDGVRHMCQEAVEVGRMDDGTVIAMLQSVS